MADKIHLIGESQVSLQGALHITASVLGIIAFSILVNLVFSPIRRRRVNKEWYAVNGSN